MLSVTNDFKTAIDARTRRFTARVELYTGSTLNAAYTVADAIKSITIDRVGEESKFFGFIVSHKFNIKLRDVQREINVSTENHLKISIGVKIATGAIEYVNYPLAYVTEVHRDENTNELSITAYDLFNASKNQYVGDLSIEAPYTIEDVINTASEKIGAANVDIGKNVLNLTKLDYSIGNVSGFVINEIKSNSIRFTIGVNGSWAYKKIPLKFEENGKYTFTFQASEDCETNVDSYGRIYGYIGVNEFIKGTTTINKKYENANIGKTKDLYFKDFDVDIDKYDYYLYFYPTAANATTEETTFCWKNLGILKGGETYNHNYESRIAEFDLEYENGANFEGTETLYEALRMAAEATQTICFLNNNNELVFKRLDKDGAATKTLTKDNYITLKSSTNRRLQTIASVTELGDNVSASTTQAGTTQYIRDNAFLELREDIASLIEEAVANVGNMTINQFDCNWRSDPSLEVGDKIDIVTKDNETVTTYIINDTIKFGGGLEESSSWSYEESEETESNPSSLGEVLKQTYAKVNKAEKQIEIVASETSSNSDAIGSLQLNTESISASVKNIETNTAEAIDNLNTDISAITKQVEAKMSAEDVTIAIQSQIENGVDKVTTTTGFTLDENGLNISKTGSEMTTQINEDGMTIHRDNEEVLKANNEGVTAYNLHANTYLIVGESSRFEDYEKDGETRTGCFWIGG